MSEEKKTTPVVIPPNAKQPQDHKKSAAQIEAENAVITVKHSGVTYKIERDSMDDVELMESLADLETNPLLLGRIVRKIVGEEQWDKFLSANRNDKGRVPSGKLGELFQSIDESVGKSKASPTS